MGIFLLVGKTNPPGGWRGDATGLGVDWSAPCDRQGENCLAWGRGDCDSGTGSTLGCFHFSLFLLFFFFFFLFLLRFQILLHCVCVTRTMGVVDQPILNESIWIEVE
ncbi:uncharacterized protein BO88DRAFT_208094 [Aspergillus vadensis CBS 113365]|uniref:Uncharacterized protein n=1 Tax=Aspergillus vadensis (strain CBS 113365 / IMI 142717 / IBT 24658) TaxID=1448311 RepID=A0A319BMC2_ASPVC|nr:hypothetical protein BO88DRAFT_208094 [Aspergillus vadensis CBS 113365]PYH72230.1 hypothetical protein BO88DRAFT_208094 [Aspergillus vadensis CBS 113365]